MKSEMTNEAEKIRQNLRSVRNMKANIALTKLKALRTKLERGEEITSKEYKQLKEYEEDLKDCLVETLLSVNRQ